MTVSSEIQRIVTQFATIEHEIEDAVTKQSHSGQWYQGKLLELRGLWQRYQDLEDQRTGAKVNGSFSGRIVRLQTLVDPWVAPQAIAPADVSDGKSSSGENPSIHWPEVTSSISPILGRRGSPATNVVPDYSLPPLNGGAPTSPQLQPDRICVVHPPRSDLV